MCMLLGSVWSIVSFCETLKAVRCLRALQDWSYSTWQSVWPSPWPFHLHCMIPLHEISFLATGQKHNQKEKKKRKQNKSMKNSSYARRFLAQNTMQSLEYALLWVLGQKSGLLVPVFTYANIMFISFTRANPSVNDLRSHLQKSFICFQRNTSICLKIN